MYQGSLGLLEPSTTLWAGGSVPGMGPTVFAPLPGGVGPTVLPRPPMIQPPATGGPTVVPPPPLPVPVSSGPTAVVVTDGPSPLQPTGRVSLRTVAFGAIALWLVWRVFR